MMINQVKIMREMVTSQGVLNYLGFIQKIKEAESLKGFIGINNEYKSYDKLETIAYKIAVKKANTVEEIEKCAVSVEENYTGQLDPDELAEQIRIKAYGLGWYLKRQFNTPAYQGFVDFTNEMGIDNPFEGLQGELS